jgi:hypothetical protein
VRTTIRLLFGSLVLSLWLVPVRSQQAPSPPATSPAPTAEQQAEREKRMAARKAEMAERTAKRQTEAVRRNAERKAEFAKRAEERKLENEKTRVEREAAATRRAAEAEKRRTEGTFRLLSSRMSSNFRNVVKGAPYSARSITEYIQKFVDGNQIVRRNESAHYRDSEGRLRVEQQLNNIGKWSASGDAPRIVMIGDPVSGEYYNLDPRTRTAVKNVGLGRNLAQQRLRQEAKTDLAARSTAPATARAAAQISDDGRRRIENLGSQRIEGVEAVGKRITRTIPAGEIGNTLPIEITDESWYSPELQMMVMTKHHDPREGDTIYRLTNINRSEPDRSLFQVPADYRVIDSSSPETTAPKTKTEKVKRSKSEVVIE